MRYKNIAFKRANTSLNRWIKLFYKLIQLTIDDIMTILIIYRNKVSKSEWTKKIHSKVTVIHRTFDSIYVKKNEELYFCVDYRKLNETTIKNRCQRAGCKFCVISKHKQLVWESLMQHAWERQIYQIWSGDEKIVKV